MSDIIAQVPQWLTVIALVLMAVVIATTVIARAMKNKVLEDRVGSFGKILLKAVTFLPSFGKDPKMKLLEQTLREVLADPQAEIPAVLAPAVTPAVVVEAASNDTPKVS